MVIVMDPYIAGISGDMVLCALVDLGADKNRILEGVKKCEKFLSESEIKKIEFTKIQKHGIQSTSLNLEIKENTHERNGMDIKQAIKNSLNEINLSENAKNFAEACVDTLISAESNVHGIPKESVHFHEASSIDTLIDIVGTAIAADDLNLFEEEIFSMPVCVGNGTVTFSHGTMTNPASAILEIFKNSSLVIHGKNTESELTTPTGASILVNLAKSSVDYYPSMKIESIGYGAGKNDFERFSNVLKIVRGKKKNDFDSDSVIILETNVDDVSGEIMGNLIEKIMDNGAKDAFISHGITKKGRPTNLVKIICDNENYDVISNILIDETGTLGIRISTSDRLILPRSIHNIKLTFEGKEFDIQYKVSIFQGKSSFKIEFDDLKRISDFLKKSIRETESLIRNEILKKAVTND
ncbi:MAG: nickel pincer cofactor biosynthesis protein LarC [Candidatus Nitrosomaritimum yanchengensis]